MEDALKGLLWIGFFIAYFWLILRLLRWCVEDARRRNTSPIAVCFLVGIVFPAGWLLWMAFRPEIDSKYEVELRKFRK